MRRPLAIYVFATDPFWISLYMRKIWFSFLSVWTVLVIVSSKKNVMQASLRVNMEVCLDDLILTKAWWPPDEWGGRWETLNLIQRWFRENLYKLWEVYRPEAEFMKVLSWHKFENFSQTWGFCIKCLYYKPVSNRFCWKGGGGERRSCAGIL